MNKHRIKNFITNNTHNIKFFRKTCIFLLVIFIILILSSNVFSQENNSTNNTNNNGNTSADNNEINNGNNTSDNSDDSNNIETNSDDSDDEDNEEDNTFERSIEYNEEVTEADKQLYEKWEKDIEFGVSEKKLDIIKNIEKLKKSYFLPLLTMILEEESNPDVIVQAVRTVAALQYYEASEQIYPYLDMDNMNVLPIVVSTLGLFKYEPLKARIEEFLDSDNVSLKNQAILAVGRLDMDDLTFFLIDEIYYAPNPKEVHMESVLISLGRLGNEDALEFLLEVYEDETNSTSQRSIAFRGLILNKYGNIHEHIKKALSSKNITLKLEAVRSMFLLDKEEVPLESIYSSLRDDNPNVRVGALRVIAHHKFNDERTIEFLKYIIENDPEDVLRYVAVGTLLTVDKDTAVPYIEERIKKGDTKVQTAVVGLLNLLPADKAIEYATQELNKANLTESEFDALLNSIKSIEDDAGLNLLIDIAQNPLDYTSTKNSREYYGKVLKQLTLYEENETIISTFRTLIKDKYSITAITLYPDLYTDDMVPLMLDVIENEDQGIVMKKRAIWNIIQFGEYEDHLKLKNLYESSETPENIKTYIKGAFRNVGINIDILGETENNTSDSNTNNDNSDEDDNNTSDSNTNNENSDNENNNSDEDDDTE